MEIRGLIMFHWDGLEYPKGATQLIKRRVINFEEIFSLFTKSFGNDKTSVYLVAYLICIFDVFD